MESKFRSVHPLPAIDMMISITSLAQLVLLIYFTFADKKKINYFSSRFLTGNLYSYNKTLTIVEKKERKKESAFSFCQRRLQTFLYISILHCLFFAFQPLCGCSCAIETVYVPWLGFNTTCLKARLRFNIIFSLHFKNK